MGIALQKMTPHARRELALGLLPGGTEPAGNGVIRALCPFHADKNPSFDYDAAKDLFHCLGCGEGGDLAKLFIHVRGLDPKAGFKEFLRDHCGGPDTFPGPGPVPAAPVQTRPRYEPKTHELPPALWQEKAGKLVGWAETNLTNNPEQRAWLQARGISDETVRMFRLGWNPTDTYRPLESWGLPPVVNATTGVPRKLWIPQGLVIPFFDETGNLVRVKIRRPNPESGPSWARDRRYQWISGGGSSTWVINPARSRVYVLVETELDGLLVHQAAGDLVGVIALGSASARPDQAAWVALDQAAVILNALDSDDAGAKQSWKWWSETFPRSERWPVPSGKDPGEFHENGGDVRTWVMAGIPDGLLRVMAMARTKRTAPQPLPGNRVADTAEQTTVATTAASSCKPDNQEAEPLPPSPRWIQELDRMEGLLATCASGRLYVAANNVEGIGGRGCNKCWTLKFPFTPCDREAQAGLIVNNELQVQEWVRTWPGGRYHQTDQFPD